MILRILLLMSFFLAPSFGHRHGRRVLVARQPRPDYTPEVNIGTFDDTFPFAPKPKIQQFHVTSNIQYRYAQTVVETYVKNPSSEAQEIAFAMVLPETAFITNFSMILRDDQEFVAKVAEKEKAENVYRAAVQQHVAAGLLHQDSRETNQVVVSVNVEARGKARFRLTYEELLQRRLSRYQHVIHVNLDQVVEDFLVQVFINESLPVTRIRVPKFKFDENALDAIFESNEIAEVESMNEEDPFRVKVTFNPDGAFQEQMIRDKSGKGGIHGQFIVEYDVDRKNQGNDVQVLDGYFVHFFAPDYLETLPKHVVFVLDISGSMYGEKLRQTKDAMVTILDDLSEKDHFNILTFSDRVTPWVSNQDKYVEGPHSMTYPGTKELKKEALDYVLQLRALGGTNIHDAMMRALDLITDVYQAEVVLPANTKPIIIFLTDGEPTVGVVNRVEIKSLIKRRNENLEVPIYGLAFGRGADFKLIKSISLASGGFARKIFEGSNAALQLEDFYLELANPLLEKVSFNYIGDSFVNDSITMTDFKTFFKGTEYIVAGKINQVQENFFDGNTEIVVGGQGENGTFLKTIPLCWTKPTPLSEPTDSDSEEVFPSRIFSENCIFIPPRPKPEPEADIATTPAQNFIERLWAYLTIKNLLKDKKSKIKEPVINIYDDVFEYDVLPEENSIESKGNYPEKPKPLPSETKFKTNEEKALQLALKYNFVTELTSLIVTRPEFSLNPEVDNSTLVIIEPIPTMNDQPYDSQMRFHYGPPGPPGPPGNAGIRRKGRMPMPMIPSRASGPQFRHAIPLPYTRSKARHGLARNFGLSFTPGPIDTSRSPINNKLMSLEKMTAPKAPYDSSDDYMSEYDDLQSMIVPLKTTTTTTTQGPCVGEISLFSMTYLRGDNVTTNEDIPNLERFNFRDKVTSLEVRGICCWMLHSEENFSGDQHQFKPGKYKSSGDLRRLFRNVASVRNIGVC